MNWTTTLLSVGLLSGQGCGTPRKESQDGTARMAAELVRIYDQALADPARNPFLNRRRADTMQAMIARQTGSAVLGNRYLLAQERLRAGQTREAIAELQSLIQAAGLSREKITPENKPVFDLFAAAYLRLAEQENCLDNPSADVCILPFVRGGQHTREEGARQAIALYQDLLQRFPDDRGSQWLLNIAAMTVGGYPSLVPKRYLIPGLAVTPKSTFPRFPDIAGAVGVAVNGHAGGLSVEDFNRDGFLDLFLTSFGPSDPVHFFLADGKGGYVNHTSEAGLDGIVGGLNTVHADYDNDGYADVLVLRGAWLEDAGAHPNSLLHNRGDGTFEDVTFAAGLISYHPTQTAAWADFNLDGYLDLFIGNESHVRDPSRRSTTSHRSELFVNDRDGTFTEVSHQVGIDLDDFVKGVVWGDVNNDGLPDLFASVLTGTNRLYLNRGGRSLNEWRFEERSATAGVQLPVFSFPAWFWDFDQDGWEDLLVLSYDLRHVNEVHEAVAREYLGLPVQIAHEGRPVEVEHSRLFRNRGDGTFEDVTRKAGVDKVLYAMGSNFGDLDNDGWLDFYVGTGTPDLRAIVPNRMFRNVDGRRFEEVTLEGGFGHIQKGHATAFADLDRDGDQDVYMVMGGAYEGDRFTSVLFENPGWLKRAWVTLGLEGRSANRSAIGARVELIVVDTNGARRTLTRTVGTGGSFGAGSLQLEIGLGSAVRAEHLRIRWPDAGRTTTSYPNLPVNRVYHIVQGEEPVVLPRPPVPLRRALPAAEHHRQGSALARSIVLGATVYAFSLPQDASAQATIRGRVISPTLTPLAGVEIGVTGVSSKAITDSTGSFRLSGLPSGLVVLRARRIGYKGQYLHVTLDSGSTRTAEIMLEPGAYILPEIEVTAKGSKPIEFAGTTKYDDFFRRRRLGLPGGTFIDRDEIRRQSAMRTAELLKNVPGARVIYRGQSGRGIVVEFSRCTSGHVGVWVDGRKINWQAAHQQAEGISLSELNQPPNQTKNRWREELAEVLDRVHPLEIEFMEVYRGIGSIPGEFGDAGCGAIAIWTR